MCLLLLALNAVPARPWLLLGNRDEFHARPTAPAQTWADAPAIVGGRDLKAGGSWLALNRNGRYAAVTNVRSGLPASAPRSRGELVGDFVAGRATPADYCAAVASRRDDYGPFNLVVGDGLSAGLVSSVDGVPVQLAAGIHLFSNGPPAHEWPKMRRLRTRFAQMLQSGKVDDAAFLDSLFDSEQPGDTDLPDTGVGPELERRLAPMFIRGETYGTRASTLAYARADGGLVLIERRFGPNAVAAGESTVEL
jgi:uncharacterized protein with NRDE domain